MADTQPTDTRMDGIKPPRSSVGVIGWVRANLFNVLVQLPADPGDPLPFLKTVPPFIRWAFIDSSGRLPARNVMATDGACWSVIPANFRFILFGFYPYDEQWRPAVAIAMLVGLLFYSQ